MHKGMSELKVIRYVIYVNRFRGGCLYTVKEWSIIVAGYWMLHLVTDDVFVVFVLFIVMGATMAPVSYPHFWKNRAQKVEKRQIKFFS
jgi:hypothetical protein